MSAALTGVPQQAPPQPQAGAPQGPAPNPWEPVAQTPMAPPPSGDTPIHASLALGAAHHAAGSAQAAQSTADEMRAMMASLESHTEVISKAVDVVVALVNEVRQTAQDTQFQQHQMASFQEAAAAMREMTAHVAEIVADMKAPRKVTVQRDKDGALTGATSEVTKNG